MSSVNVDKALQIRPPIAIYVLELPDGTAQTFDIPGVPNNIGGSGPEGAHEAPTLNPPTPTRAAPTAARRSPGRTAGAPTPTPR